MTDSQSAVVRLPSWAGCLVAMQEGVEPVMQVQCRDKNRIALQSDLLGAAALGIPNVLLLTGDHPRFGDHPDAFPEFDGDAGPKGALKAAEWRYGSETFQFKRNKLLKPKK